MQAIILAGGKGTRLRPFTASLPKPLVPLGDMPIIEVVLRQLKSAGFREVVISTGHMSELIQAFCGDGKRWGLRLRYVHERKPLSTAGALKLVKGLAPDFMTINGDILTTLDFKALHEKHRKTKSMATVSVCERKTVVDFGVIGLDAEGRVASYTEKPEHKYLVSMGVNMFSRKVLDFIEPGEFLGIPELIRRLQASGKRVTGFRSRCDWLDIGRPQDYETAQGLFASPRARARYLR